MLSRLKQPQPGPSNRFTHAGMLLLTNDNIKYHSLRNRSLDDTANDIKVQSLLNYTCTECTLEALITLGLYKSQMHQCKTRDPINKSFPNFLIEYLKWLRKKETCLISLRRKIATHPVLPTTTEFPPPQKFIPGVNLAHSLGNANTPMKNLHYADGNLRSAQRTCVSWFAHGWALLKWFWLRQQFLAD